MNSLELQEKLIKFQKELRNALEVNSDNVLIIHDSDIMRKIDMLLCMHETGVKPLRPKR